MNKVTSQLIGGFKLFQARRILTNAEIKALPTTAIEIIPAPGSLKTILPITGYLRHNYTANYTNINASAKMSVRLAAATDLGMLNEAILGQTLSALLANTADGDAQLNFNSMSSGTGLTENAAYNLYINNNSAGDLTGGDALNSLQVDVIFAMLDIQ